LKQTDASKNMARLEQEIDEAGCDTFSRWSAALRSY